MAVGLSILIFLHSQRQEALAFSARPQKPRSSAFSGSWRRVAAVQRRKNGVSCSAASRREQPMKPLVVGFDSLALNARASWRWLCKSRSMVYPRAIVNFKRWRDWRARRHAEDFMSRGQRTPTRRHRAAQQTSTRLPGPPQAPSDQYEAQWAISETPADRQGQPQPMRAREQYMAAPRPRGGRDTLFQSATKPPRLVAPCQAK